MDVPRTQAPEHVPDDVLDLAVPSADVSLTPPLVGANAPARLSLTMWGFGKGERLRPPPMRRERDAFSCTSDFCRRAVGSRIR